MTIIEQPTPIVIPTEAEAAAKAQRRDLNAGFHKRVIRATPDHPPLPLAGAKNEAPG